MRTHTERQRISVSHPGAGAYALSILVITYVYARCTPRPVSTELGRSAVGGDHARPADESRDGIGIGPAEEGENIYPDRQRKITQMFDSPSRAVAFVLYQLTLVLGIALMPVAMVTRRFGVTLPLGKAVTAAGQAYENAA
jgi:hypothetical protein